MAILTAEQIAKQTEDKNSIANIRAINKLYREQDDSNLFPILGKFNATERAIQRAYNKHRKYYGGVYGLEYCLILEQHLSEIVNGELL